MTWRFWTKKSRSAYPLSEGAGICEQGELFLATQSIYSKFVLNADDARGHIALALFLKEKLEQNEGSSSEEIIKAVSRASSSSLEAVYFPAAMRILQSAASGLATKEASRAMQESLLLVEITSLIDEKHSITSDRLDRLTAELSFPKQVLVVAAATLVSAIAVVLLASLLEPIAGLMSLVRGGSH